LARKHSPLNSGSSPYNICTSKRRFTTKKLAEAAAEYQMLLKPELDLSVYTCGQCGGWHLTRNTNLIYNV
jgi:hypothetical protein